MNRGSDSILSVYSDARAEYTKQLCVFLVPAYFQFFTELLEKAKQSMVNEPKRALWQFQNLLNEIHDWNIQKVTTEINVIHTNCGCDYLEDLLTAVFIAHTKVLTAIRLSSNNKKVEINIPKVEHFLFKALCETAKLLWSSTYLFREGIPGIEKQQNYRMIEQLINEGILQAVRGLVPVKSILKDFVNGDNGVDEEEDSDNEVETQQQPEKEEDKPAPITELTIPQPVVLGEISLPVVQQGVPSTIEQPVVELPPKNEVVEPTVEEKPQIEEKQPPQTIIIDEKPSVRFGEFDAVFDSDHPMNSEMIYEPKDGDDDDDVPALEILDGDGSPLADGIDFDDIEGGDKSETIGAGEYEEL